ncbi:hypothetical protein M0804_003668 [Polistes exclamans]|nr:hypothetical protein M0804_003668 [Polistes exclamans]
MNKVKLYKDIRSLVIHMCTSIDCNYSRLVAKVFQHPTQTIYARLIQLWSTEKDRDCRVREATIYLSKYVLRQS